MSSRKEAKKIRWERNGLTLELSDVRLIKAWGLNYPSEHVTPVTEKNLAQELLDLYLHTVELKT